MADSPETVKADKEEDMNPSQAAEHLRIIRELMERPLRFTTRSGLSGVIAGLLALVGCAATWRLTGGQIWSESQNMVQVGIVWAAVLVLAVTIDLLLTWRRARRFGATYWRRGQRQIALAIAPGFLVGGILTWLLAAEHQYTLIPAVWMLFYGMAVWSVGLFSPIEVKLLGAAFVAFALAAGATFITDHPLASLAITFGGFHLAYGGVVWARHGG